MEDVVVLDAAARLGHHLRDSVPPGLVVGCFLMAGGICLFSVNFDQDEAGGVIQLLDHVEAGDSRLPHTVANVLPRGLLEGSLQGRVRRSIIQCNITPCVELQKTMHTLVRGMMLIDLDKKDRIRYEMELRAFRWVGEPMASMREYRV